MLLKCVCNLERALESHIFSIGGWWMVVVVPRSQMEVDRAHLHCKSEQLRRLTTSLS
jgi:hypothetical protein